MPYYKQPTDHLKFPLGNLYINTLHADTILDADKSQNHIHVQQNIYPLVIPDTALDAYNTLQLPA